MPSAVCASEIASAELRGQLVLLRRHMINNRCNAASSPPLLIRLPEAIRSIAWSFLNIAVQVVKRIERSIVGVDFAHLFLTRLSTNSTRR